MYDQGFASLDRNPSIAAYEVRTTEVDRDTCFSAVGKAFNAIAATRRKNESSRAGFDAERLSFVVPFSPICAVVGAKPQVDRAPLQISLRQIVFQPNKIEQRPIIKS